jgi:type IV pilus assembly protein PilW
MTGVVQVFLSAKMSYSTQQALGRVQENTRFLLEMIGKDIRNIGYSGCGLTAEKLDNSKFINKLNDSNYALTDFTSSISGINNNSGAAITIMKNISITPNAGTDILLYKTVSDLGVSIDSSHISDANLGITNTGESTCTSPKTGNSSTMLSGICEGDILIVSDCEKSVLFQATQVNSSSEIVVHSSDNGFTPGNKDVSWEKSLEFSSGAELLKASASALYIRNDTNGRPGLFARSASNPSQDIQLVSDVEDMQILFGVDTSSGTANDGAPDVYQTPNNVVNSNKIVSVQLSFLLSSPDPALETPQTITFNNATVPSSITNDRRLRQVVSMTIALRNRLK